jgi:hypothetical protein
MDQTGELEAFLERVRSLLGPNPPAVGPGEVEAILELARVAAHASERRAAPVTTYLAGLVLAAPPPRPARRSWTTWWSSWRSPLRAARGTPGW